MVSSRLIWKGPTEPSSHAATIVEVGHGEMLASWFAGDEENAPNVGIYTSRWKSISGWDRFPREVVPPYTRQRGLCGGTTDIKCKRMNSTWNPVLAAMPDGEVLLFYKIGPHPSEWQGRLKRSRDKGQKWGKAEHLPPGVIGPSKNKPLIINGRILSPTSTESTKGLKRKWQCWVEESVDAGRTWSVHGPVQFDGNIIQPSLFLDRYKQVRMVARSATDYSRQVRPGGAVVEARADPTRVRRGQDIRPGKKYMVFAKSDALGRKWAPARTTTLPCPNSGLDAVRLADGRIIVVFNDSFQRKQEARNVLSVAVSLDDGETWARSYRIEDAQGQYDAEGKPYEFSYPSVVQASDGLVHIVYTYLRKNVKHVILDPTRLRPRMGEFKSALQGIGMD